MGKFAKLGFGLGAAALALAATPANAATFISSYNFTVTNTTGPVPNQSGSFSLELDDVDLSHVALTAINYTLGAVSFDTLTAGAEAVGTTQIRIGGVVSGLSTIDQAAGLADFFLRFDRNTLATQNFVYYDGITPAFGGLPGNVTVTAAVPEPATWAMLILGFGLVGAAMRKRQSVRVRYA